MAEKNRVEAQAASACCGGPAPKETDACCVKDADAKAAGESGCGCGVPSNTQANAQESKPAAAASCCG